MKRFAPLVLFLSACTASLVTAEGQIKTIGFATGPYASDKLYFWDFTRGAEAACRGPYNVLERTRTPSTLHGMKLEDYDFYWVIECRRE